MLCVNGVVLPMRTDEPNVDDSIRIVDPDHNAIFISRYIEHCATVRQNPLNSKLNKRRHFALSFRNSNGKADSLFFSGKLDTAAALPSNYSN